MLPFWPVATTLPVIIFSEASVISIFPQVANSTTVTLSLSIVSIVLKLRDSPSPKTSDKLIVCGLKFDKEKIIEPWIGSNSGNVQLPPVTSNTWILQKYSSNWDLKSPPVTVKLKPLNTPLAGCCG